MRSTVLSRRAALIGTSALSVAALAACSLTPALDAQILADASGVVSSLSAVASQVNTLAPGKVPASVTNGLSVAQGLVASLSTATPIPTGASTLQTVDGYINAALQAFATVLPAAALAFPVLVPAIPIVDGAIALLPVIEAYVNPLIQQLTPSAPAAASAPLHPIMLAMTPAQARAALGIATVK